MKAVFFTLLFAPSLILAALVPQREHAGVAHHRARLSGANFNQISPYTPHAKRGPAKPRRCAARIASISSASVSSTSVHAKQTHHTTTTTHKPKPTEKDDEKDDDKGSSGDGEEHTGDATVYGAGLNACGTVDKKTDMIAAIAWQNFDNYPGANGNSNENPICGKRVKACWQGNCVEVAIHDRCAGCQKDDLDFSPSAFKLLHPNNGRLHGMKWHWI